jgi:hypothetical protein
VEKRIPGIGAEQWKTITEEAAPTRHDDSDQAPNGFMNDERLIEK